jgi:hypothetical protein
MTKANDRPRPLPMEPHFMTDIYWMRKWIEAGLAVCMMLVLSSIGRAQPTYKLDVKAHLKPLATLRLEAGQVRRSAVKEDPGFRLQYHFEKDGKTVSTIEARSKDIADVPKDAGTYAVVLELFYPAYKGGTEQKGAFKTISNTLTFQVKPPAKPGDPVQVRVVEPPKQPPAKK